MTPPPLRLTPRGLLAFGRRLPCTLGRTGVAAAKREGDGATPRGAHRIVGMLYRADRLAPPQAWARRIRPRDLWCDDPRHGCYNGRVVRPHAGSHEVLRRADSLYDIVLVLDWNWPVARPDGGSAIFVHRWRRRCAPTEGCIALAPRDLRWLARRVRPGQALIVR